MVPLSEPAGSADRLLDSNQPRGLNIGGLIVPGARSGNEHWFARSEWRGRS